jgi:uncharacterized membrane protein
MQMLFFVVLWLALAWYAARPIARKAFQDCDSDNIAAFIGWWALFALLVAIPALILTVVWPVTLVGLALGALYVFVPKVKSVVDAKLAQIKEYAEA